MTRTLLVLGAGASHDCAGASATIDIKWRPPLARDLFAVSRHSNYEPILRQHPGARVLASMISEHTDRDIIGLEEQLRLLSTHTSPVIRHHFADVPRYICHLISEVEQRFTTTPSSYVLLCLKLLAELGHHVVVISLNYDTLFEQALSLVDSRYTFNAISDYTKHDRQLWLFKPHGSTNWRAQGVPSPRRIVIGQPETPRSFTPPSGDMDIEILTGDFRNEEWFPVLTAPLASKSGDDIRLPIVQQQQLSGVLSECTSGVFIGFSARDLDVLDLLKSRLPRLVKLHVVSPDDCDGIIGRLGAHVPSIAASSVFPFKVGFREYISGSDILQLRAT